MHLNLMKKALSLGTSAALVASLLATVGAPAALATIAVTTPVGTFAQGTTSATAGVWTFTENSAAALSTTGTMTVTITPGGTTPTGSVAFVGTPVLTGNVGSLGASASLTAPNVLTITITGNDPLNVETLVVSGLQISASANASQGNIVATLGGTSSVYSAFQGGSYTATGKLAQAYGVGTTSWLVAVDSTSACDFAGTNTVTVGSETLTPTGVGTKTVGGQQLFATNAFSVNHLANEVVTQSVPLGGPGTNCSLTTLPSPGTVAAALTFDAPATPTVYPGENFAPAGDLTLHENASTGIGYIAAGDVITAKIATAGVTFSVAPVATAYGNSTIGNTTSSPDNRAAGFSFVATPTNSNPALGVLSADKTSVSWTVNTASSGLVRLVVSGIQYNVASTVAGGGSVSVGVTVTGDLVNPASQANAVFARPVTATSTSTNVYIGETNQAAGTISIVENSAGTFTDGTGSYNTFETCLTTGEAFSSAPSATVTVGNLSLRSGLAAVLPGTAVVGTPFTSNTGNSQCYYWTVWSASTVASTITISGINVDVPSTLATGNTNVAVSIGSVSSMTLSNAIILTIATRLFRHQVAVTALSQPVIPAGALAAAVGNIQIAETGYGQLKANEVICVGVLPRTTNGLRTQDTFIAAMNTASLPTLLGANGIVVNNVTMGACDNNTYNYLYTGLSPAPQGYARTFGFTIAQQSLTSNGMVTIGNLLFSTTADAPTGPVSVAVWGVGGAPTSLQFEATVSNARIGVAPKLNIAANSALGLNPTSGYTMKTPKYQAVGKYVTWKFTGGPALAGQRVNVLVAKHINGAWGGPVYYKSAWADANGIVTFAWTSKTAAAINVRVQWPGTIAYAVSTSKALGAYYK
jgi:hypothetical protein